jgi:hypothetical protein
LETGLGNKNSFDSVIEPDEADCSVINKGSAALITSPEVLEFVLLAFPTP